MSIEQWDTAAPQFDNEADHGLRDPVVRAAWQELLLAWLPPNPVRVLDIGCGTGSLSVLAAEAGHTVTGVDFSPAMIALAREKASVQGLSIDFHVADAKNLVFPGQAFDVILCRHLLWALSDPAAVLQRWQSLLSPEGQMILIEGFWSTGAGLPASSLTAMIPTAFTSITVHDLSPSSALWGKTVSDERYAILAKRR